MWKNAIVATLTLMFSGVLFLFGALDFLSTYKQVLLQRYGFGIGLYLVLVGVNLYAAFLLLTRKLFLKDTGTKLVHLEKQLRDGSIPHDLGVQLTTKGN